MILRNNAHPRGIEVKMPPPSVMHYIPSGVVLPEGHTWKTLAALGFGRGGFMGRPKELRPDPSPAPARQPRARRPRAYSQAGRYDRRPDRITCATGRHPRPAGGRCQPCQNAAARLRRATRAILATCVSCGVGMASHNPTRRKYCSPSCRGKAERRVA